MRIMKWLAVAIITLWAMGCGTTAQVTDCQCPDPSEVETAAKAQTAPVPHVSAKLDFKPGIAIVLPAPQKSGGMPLLETIAMRHSVREFGRDMLSLEQLSSMLFAAHGITRPENNKRSTPTAMNWQGMEIYVSTATGLFVYDAEAHSLAPVQKDDIRATTGKQPFVATAPVNLIYVSDYSRMEIADETQKSRYAAAHAGFISQNVYLYCTSEGLATVVRAYYDEEALHAAMKLPETKHIVLAQTVGFPAKEAQ